MYSYLKKIYCLLLKKESLASKALARIGHLISNNSGSGSIDEASTHQDIARPSAQLAVVMILNIQWVLLYSICDGATS